MQYLLVVLIEIDGQQEVPELRRRRRMGCWRTERDERKNESEVLISKKMGIARFVELSSS